MTEAAIGIDIGGTNVKLGLVDRDRRGLSARRRYAYAGFTGFEDFVEVTRGGGARHVVRHLASPLRHRHRRAGTCARERRRHGRRHCQRAAAARTLARRWRCASWAGFPTGTLNDGAAATLGELRWGGGRGLDRFAVVTLGTGVGGGVALAGRVIAGNDGEPPEIGAMVLDADAGPNGTFEALACAAGFSNAYARAGGLAAVDPETIFARAERGEVDAVAALDTVCRRIAQACGSMINLLNLEACLLGGGISAAGEPLRARVEAHLPAFTWPYLFARSRLDLARTEQDAGILGAAARALAARGL